MREGVDRSRCERQALGVGFDELDPLRQARGGDPLARAGEHVGALVDADDLAGIAAGERDRHGARAGGDIGDDRARAIGGRRHRLDHHIVPAPVLPEREQLRPAVVVGGDAGEQAAGVALALRDGGHRVSIAQACRAIP